MAQPRGRRPSRRRAGGTSSFLDRSKRDGEHLPTSELGPEAQPELQVEISSPSPPPEDEAQKFGGPQMATLRNLVPEGTPIGTREGGRKYNVPHENIRTWAMKGEVLVLKEPAHRGDTRFVDERSLQVRLRRYRPHADNQPFVAPPWRTLILDWLQEEDRSQGWLSQRAAMQPCELNHLLTGRVKVTTHILNKLETAMGLTGRLTLGKGRGILSQPPN